MGMHHRSQVREGQLGKIIYQELASLPERVRIIFQMSRKQHLSHKEIADELDISEKTIKNQVNGALKVLRTKLGLLVYLLLLSNII